MSKSFKIGSSYFPAMREGFLVDKTETLATLIEEKASITVISAPRRFGKSTFSKMVRSFFSYHEKSECLFANMAIAKVAEGEFMKKHMNQYAVVHLSLTVVQGYSFKKMLMTLKERMKDLYRCTLRLSRDELDQFSDIFTNHLKDSLSYLIHELHKKSNKKVIVLIDEYEANSYEALTENYYDEYIQFMRSFFEVAFSTNTHVLQFALFTGVLPFGHVFLDEKSMPIKFLNMAHATIGNFIGATVDEFKKTLLESNHILKEPDLITLEKWYGGYQIGLNTYINIWSASLYACDKMHAPDKTNAEGHWTQKADQSFIFDILNRFYSVIKEELQALTRGAFIGKRMSFDLTMPDLMSDNVDNLWSLLFITGYLTLTKKSAKQGVSSEYELVLPNQEIKIFFTTYLNRKKESEPLSFFKPFAPIEKKSDTTLLIKTKITDEKTRRPFFQQPGIRKPLTREEVRVIGLAYLSPRYVPKK